MNINLKQVHSAAQQPYRPYLSHSPSLSHDFGTFSSLNKSPAFSPLSMLSVVIWLYISLNKEKQLVKNFHKLQTMPPYGCIHPAFSQVIQDELLRLLSKCPSWAQDFIHPGSISKLPRFPSIIKHQNRVMPVSTGCLLGQHLFLQLGAYTVPIVAVSSITPPVYGPGLFL